jgi:hypothetical protein
MHRGAGTWEIAAAGGNTGCRISLGLRVPSYNTTQQLLDRVYITEARRPEECEEGIGVPDHD